MLDNLPLYLLAALTFNLFPGPDMLYIIRQSVGHGKRMGVAASLGIAAGCCIHIFAVVIGLSTLLFKSAFAFSIVKYLGACYLLYLGITSLIKKPSISLMDNPMEKSASWWRSFWQGFLTDLLNPKVALFFLAFLPQFVVASSPYSIGLQMLILGLIFNCSGTIINILVAYFFGAARNWLTTHPFALHIQQKVTGIILIGLGIRLAALERV